MHCVYNSQQIQENVGVLAIKCLYISKEIRKETLVKKCQVSKTLLFKLVFLTDGRDIQQLRYRGNNVQLLNKEMSEFVVIDQSVEIATKRLFMGMSKCLCSLRSQHFIVKYIRVQKSHLNPAQEKLSCFLKSKVKNIF